MNLLGQIKIEIEKNARSTTTQISRAVSAGATLSRIPAELDTVKLGLDRWFERNSRQLEHSMLEGYRRIIRNVLALLCARV